MTGQGIDRIPDSLGYLVLTEEGAVVSVSGFKLIALLQAVLID